jgi:hypothetical protein
MRPEAPSVAVTPAPHPVLADLVRPPPPPTPPGTCAPTPACGCRPPAPASKRCRGGATAGPGARRSARGPAPWTTSHAHRAERHRRAALTGAAARPGAAAADVLPGGRGGVEYDGG